MPNKGSGITLEVNASPPTKSNKEKRSILCNRAVNRLKISYRAVKLYIVETSLTKSLICHCARDNDRFHDSESQGQIK